MMRRVRRPILVGGFVVLVGVALAADVPEPPRAGRGEVPWGMARELSELAAQLSERERTLDRRERTIEAREADLAAVEARLIARTEELQALREEIAGLLERLDADQEDRVDDLVRRVEAMRDGQAAAVLSETDPELAVEVLRRMTPSKAGKAMAKIEPRLAGRLAERMAARVDPPEVP